MKLFVSTLMQGPVGPILSGVRSCHYLFRSCAVYRDKHVFGNNATAIGLSLSEENISRSQSLASNPTQDGVVPLSSYFFLDFCSVKLAKQEF